MGDKVQKILSEITTRKLCTMDEHMTFYNDKAKEDYRLLSEKEEVIKALQEEPVSGKKCMFTKDSYTDEDRKVLCEDCDEKCEYSKKEEPVSEDEAEKQFNAGDVVMYVSRHPAYSGLYLLGNPNDLSIGYSNANEPYQIVLRNCTVASEDERKQFMRELNDNGYKWNESTLSIEEQEPVSEELNETISGDIIGKELRSFLFGKKYPTINDLGIIADVARHFANWQKQQMIDKACEWIKMLNDTHYIMRYSDSCEVISDELIEWFKNYMEE